jgi:hypothetical protein
LDFPLSFKKREILLSTVNPRFLGVGNGISFTAPSYFGLIVGESDSEEEVKTEVVAEPRAMRAVTRDGGLAPAPDV